MVIYYCTDVTNYNEKVNKQTISEIVAHEFNVEVKECHVLDTHQASFKNTGTSNEVWLLGYNVMNYLSVADVLVLPQEWDMKPTCVLTKLVADMYDIPCVILDEERDELCK